MKIPFFTDYFSNLGAELLVIQKLNYIIKGMTNMATKQEVLDAVSAAEARVANGITAATAGLAAQITDLETKLSNGTAITATDLSDILAAVNGIALTTTPAPV